jgi:hypothetical protein
MSHPQESTTSAAAGFRELLTTAEVRRIVVPRTPVNKGKKRKGQGCQEPRPSYI